jgi:hypothetical protein
MNGAEGSGPTLARAGLTPQRRIARMLMWNHTLLCGVESSVRLEQGAPAFVISHPSLCSG